MLLLAILLLFVLQIILLSFFFLFLWFHISQYFLLALQKVFLFHFPLIDILSLNKNTEEQVSGIEGATYYELSVYDKKEQGGLLQNIRYPFVEDEWSVFNNFSFLDVNFDEYTD